MVNQPVDLSILVLTEDSGADGFDAVHAVVLGILRKIAPSAHIEHVEIEPSEDARALKSMRGNHWMGEDRSGEAELYRRDLIRSIATKLAEGGFVIFHCDGDQPWKKRKQSDKSKKFDKLMDAPIRRLLLESGFSQTIIDAAMNRLVLLIPYYSIESWLYQNTDEALRLCREQYAGRDVGQFEAWAAERHLLDEVVKPKAVVALGNKHNLSLATSSFPFDVAHAVGKSLHHAVARFEDCQELQAALVKLATA